MKWDKKFLKELLPYVIIVLMVVFIRIVMITPVKVNGASMEKTLFNGQVLLLEKVNFTYHRFDIVVINYKGEKLIKRIVGLPGETLEYKNNSLYINGKLIKEKFTKNVITAYYNLEFLGIKTIPKETYFVMGDNRTNSVDSRLLGVINKKDITGRVRFGIYPFDKFGIIN